MTKINLLPWREELREEQKNEYTYMLTGSAFLSVLIMGAVHIGMNQKISYQNARNTVLRNEIMQLDKRLKEIKELKKVKNDLLARMTMIQSLQVNRPHVVHVFDEIVKILPKGVYLADVQRKNNQLVITGSAESNTTISELMRNIHRSDWLTRPALSEIKTDETDGQRVSKFQLSISVMKKVKPLGARG